MSDDQLKPVSKATELRGLLLQQAASDAASIWSRACRAELAREGRRVEGGWPGTLREARGWAATEAAKALKKRSMSTLTTAELDALVRITYDEARKSWGARSRGD